MLPRDAGGAHGSGRGKNAFEDLRRALAQAGPDLPVHRTWTGICRLVQDRLGAARFATWIRKVGHVALDENTLTVTFHSRRARSESQAALLETVTACARAATQRPLRVLFAVGAPPAGAIPAVDPAPAEDPGEAEAPASLRAHDAATAPADRPAALRELHVGACNELAVKAVRTYVGSERTEYAPLLLHGPGGCGKTRLLEVALQAARDQGRIRAAIRVGAEEFSQQFTFALQRGKLAAFQQKYRSVDLLVVDDVHRLAHKEATQDEFLHTFDALEQSGRRVIVAALWPGRDLPGLHKRLRVRLKSGLEVRIGLPDPASRGGLLARWNRERPRPLPAEPLARLAERVEGSFETLWRAYETAVARRAVTAAHGDEAIALTAGAVPRTVSLEQVARAVAPRFGLRPEELRDDVRSRRVSAPRQLCFALARRLTGHAVQEIGAYFGGRNRATVIAGCDRVRERGDHDDAYRLLVEELARELGEPRAGA